MKRVIVTGAGGFIGHHLVKFLKANNQYVIAIDLKKPDFEPSAADKFVVHDIREKNKEWQELFEGVDDVWALAADMGGMGFISKGHGAIMSGNVTININTLEAARKQKVKRFLFTSTACVYPQSLQEKPEATSLSENMVLPADPQDGYGWEKLYTEKLCEYYSSEYDIDMRIVRFHNIYGPLGTWRGGKEKVPAALCRKVAEAVISNKDNIEIWGDGEQTRSFCYIDDCIKGLNLIMQSGYNRALNLGSDEMLSINQLADLVMEIAGIKLKKVHIAGPQGVRGRNSDNSLCKAVTGWSPEISVREGITKTYQWIYQQIKASQI